MRGAGSAHAGPGGHMRCQELHLSDGSHDSSKQEQRDSMDSFKRSHGHGQQRGDWGEI